MEKNRPDWDRSAREPNYRTDHSSQEYVSERVKKPMTDYGPSTDATQATAARKMATQIAKKRRSYRNGIWFEGDQMIGRAPNESAPISRVRPRSLRPKGVM